MVDRAIYSRTLGAAPRVQVFLDGRHTTGSLRTCHEPKVGVGYQTIDGDRADVSHHSKGVSTPERPLAGVSPKLGHYPALTKVGLLP